MTIIVYDLNLYNVFIDIHLHRYITRTQLYYLNVSTLEINRYYREVCEYWSWRDRQMYMM